MPYVIKAYFFKIVPSVLILMFICFEDKYPKEYGVLFHSLDIWHKSVKLTKKLTKVKNTYIRLTQF